jgi:hypothetical protein
MAAAKDNAPVQLSIPQTFFTAKVTSQDVCQSQPLQPLSNQGILSERD